MKKVFDTAVEYNEDFDEYFLTIPEELLATLGWEEGDVVEWRLNSDGTVLLERVDQEYYGGESNDEED
jgi:bifunctional DNA-binding transcriptional regulator/antitoxin component of YhaV-PrlF toxin-antitoxin module